MQKLKLAQLVIDWNIYPRVDVDEGHVRSMVAALEAGATLPPIVIDRASKRIIDGWHRHHAYQKFLGEDGEVECVARDYADERAMFLDAMRLNAGHGRSLTAFDRTRCVIKAKEMKIEPIEIAASLSMTVEAIGKLSVGRIGKLKKTGIKNGNAIPLKRTLKHMAGQTLTQSQFETQKKLSGMDQRFLVHQLVLIIEADLLDLNDDLLRTALDHLAELLAKLPGRASAA